MTELLLTGLVVTPGAAFLFFSFAWLLGWKPREKVVARTTAVMYSFMTLASFALAGSMAATGAPKLEVSFGQWFHAGSYHFGLDLIVDRLSMPLIILTTVLSGLTGVFSVRYLHRDRGFFRFFLLLYLFTCGALLVFSAGSLDLLLGGWEVVGITSVLLIAFFGERVEPARNAIRVFAAYRIADLGLLLAIFAIHYFAHTAKIGDLFRGDWPNQTTALNGSGATLVGLLLLVGASGKSAQIPFSGWLPRAMEGPTPSSAIFYGAIAVHLGAYLLLRGLPVLQAAPLAAAAVIVVGGTTAVLGTLAHRVSTDAKTSLAFAGMAQLGIVFVEIGFGFPQLALAHICGHAVVRTLQFLRAPSMLHDYHRVHAAAGGHIAPTGVVYQRILPAGLQAVLYRASLERGYYDALLDRFIASPVLRFARWLERLEHVYPPSVPPPQRGPADRVEGRLAEEGAES